MNAESPDGETLHSSDTSRSSGIVSAHQREEQSFAKANEAIAIRPKRGRLTLLSRRMYNALLFHAQRQGVDLPIYRLPLAELIGDARFNSNNTELLKAHLRDMQATTIEWSSSGPAESKWVSTQLIGTVKIEQSGRGHPCFISWTYPEEIRERLVRPRQYTRLMLEISAQMRSYAAAVLYEIGTRYLTSPNRLTMREDVMWWAAVLSGRSDIKKVDYRFLKRDVISKAMAEVEALCEEFSLELIEHKRGRKIQELQFRVMPRVQQRLADMADARRNVFNLELVGKLIQLGFKQDQAQDIYATTDEGVLKAAIAHVEQRQNNTALPPLRTPAAYLRDAIKRGYPGIEQGSTAGKIPSQTAAPSAETQKQRVREAWEADRRRQARALYEEMNLAAQAEVRLRFEQEEVERLATPIARAWFRDGPTSGMAASSFFEWFAQSTWPEAPTDEMLLNFALTNGIVRVD